MCSVRMDNGGLPSASTAAVVETGQTIDVSKRNQAVLGNPLVGARVLDREISSNAIAGVRKLTNTTLASRKGSQLKEPVFGGAVRRRPPQCDASISVMR
jgi:hypothetical protein